MSLAPGARLGAYEILGPLGAGGMGEVYRARDPRLARDVAIKALPEEFFESEERRQRFEREGKLLASLNHPNVAVIYSLEEIPGPPSSSSRHILVMELVEGQTLRARVKRGDLSMRAILEVAAQIARGLAAAHERGIVHRDLKPENVMLSTDGRVKILDFGLAKLSAPARSDEDLSSAGTRSLLTEAGAVMGTVGYMSPEQVRGEPLDARSDIFSLGTILYELFTGKNPFRSTTSAETMTAILRHEPPSLSEPPVAASPALSRIVARCLEKAPEKRFQSAADLAFALEASSGAARTRTGGGPERWRRVALAATLLALALGAALLLRMPGPGRVAARAIRFSVPPPDGGSFVYQIEGAFVAVSPDGSELAYVATDPAHGQRLWLRPLDALEARPLPGTEGATSVFFSPDGRSIGFFSENKLKRMDLAGGAPVPVCDVAAGGGKSGTWGREGDILFAGVQGEAIYRVSAIGGGAPDAIRRPDAARGELRVQWPWFLPDGERFLYVSRSGDTRTLMLEEADGRSRAVAAIASEVSYVDPGFLVYAGDGALLGQRFDERSGRVAGGPISIGDHVRFFFSNGSAGFAASRGGTIAWQAHEDVHGLVWFDRTGRETGSLSAPGEYLTVEFAPDGRHLLFGRAQARNGVWDVWSLDLERNVETRITSGPDSKFGAIWTRDGKSILYSSIRREQPSVVRLDLASGRETEALAPAGFQVAQDVSPDGRILAYTERNRGSFAAFATPLEGPAWPTPILPGALGTDVNFSVMRFSPDGRLLAFISDESGQPEVYVTPYPGPAERTRVSTGGARLLRWNRNGRELIYLSSDKRVVSVPVRAGRPLSVGAPEVLFTLAGNPWLSFDVAPDGKRFVAIVPRILANGQPLHVVANWPSEVEK